MNYKVGVLQYNSWMENIPPAIVNYDILNKSTFINMNDYFINTKEFWYIIYEKRVLLFNSSYPYLHKLKILF